MIIRHSTDPDANMAILPQLGVTEQYARLTLKSIMHSGGQLGLRLDSARWLYLSYDPPADLRTVEIKNSPENWSVLAVIDAAVPLQVLDLADQPESVENFLNTLNLNWVSGPLV